MHISTKPTAFHGTARDHTIFATDSGLTILMSPQGTRVLKLGEYCTDQDRYAPDHLYLTHSEDSVLFQCKKGQLSVRRKGQVSVFKLPDRKQFSTIVADSWNAPIALLDASRVTPRTLIGGFRVSRNLAVINYLTGALEVLAPVKSTIVAPIYMGPAGAFAVSPNGTKVAVLSGSLLMIYTVDQRLLSSESQHE